MSTINHTKSVEQTETRWTTADAAALYRVADWSDGYFAVSSRGTVVAQPAGRPGRSIDLHDVVQGLRDRGINPPVLLRIGDVLADRLRRMGDAFAAAIAENGYSGRYRPVFPIKTNQQRHLVEQIVEAGNDIGVGLEVGSKPELLAVMALSEDIPERLILCNGFKDARYIEATILARKLGRRIVPVVENLNELDLILEFADKYGVRPEIGVRVKLAATGAGRWSHSSGSRSKFGLFVSELVEMIGRLRAVGMLDCLKLLHCHVGSQIQDIHRVKAAISELAQTYAELVRMGASMEFIDVGGGLGIDYLGARSNTPSSMNYSLEEYASDIVYRIAQTCDAAGIPHPDVVTECGRAMVAHSSVLIFDSLGTAGPRRAMGPIDLVLDDDTPPPLADLQTAHDEVDQQRLLECYHDALAAHESATKLFSMGYLTLEQRGLADRLLWATCLRVRDIAVALPEPPDELATLNEMLSDVEFCNFSLFQSLPDAWAIDQIFPIMPIHRLREEPTRHAVLADITCDSDGQIALFIGDGTAATTITLHEPRPGETYHLGAFLVGAYQETLGDLHNLFGDAHAVHIGLDDHGSWTIEHVVRGDTAREVLGYVQYDPDHFADRIARDCERAVRVGKMTVAETRALLDFYRSGLDSYTYLES